MCICICTCTHPCTCTHTHLLYQIEECARLERAFNQERGAIVGDEKGIPDVWADYCKDFLCFVDCASLYNLVNKFLQHFKDIHIKQLLHTKNILLYTRYADDILIIYDTTRTHPHIINAHINQIHNIKLNPTYENNMCINVLI